MPEKGLGVDSAIQRAKCCVPALCVMAGHRTRLPPAGPVSHLGLHLENPDWVEEPRLMEAAQIHLHSLLCQGWGVLFFMWRKMLEFPAQPEYPRWLMSWVILAGCSNFSLDVTVRVF